MKKRIVFIFVLFLGLTGFNGESRIIEQNSVNFQEKNLCAEKAPEILRELESIIAVVGQRVTFTATVSTSVRSVIWLKDGKEIKLGDGLYTTFKNYTATLEIKSVVKEDVGN